jgi:hypothetical protein
MRKGFLIYEEMREYLVIYMRRLLAIYDFASDSFGISLNMRTIFFYFLTVRRQIVTAFNTPMIVLLPVSTTPMVNKDYISAA